MSSGSFIWKYLKDSCKGRSLIKVINYYLLLNGQVMGELALGALGAGALLEEGAHYRLWVNTCNTKHSSYLTNIT